MNELLRNSEAATVRALVVWEPILPIDVVRPTTGVLARVTDSRATQVWDPRQLIAKHMKGSAAPTQMQPECCEDDGIWWDLIAVYAPGPTWEHQFPAAAYVSGPVVQVINRAADAIRALAEGRAAGMFSPVNARSRFE